MDHRPRKIAKWVAQVFFQDNIKNMSLILLVIIVFSGVGFYSAYVIQDEKITRLTGEKDSTIDRLSSEVSYLRNIWGDLIAEYEEMEIEMRRYEDDYMQKSVEYTDLSEKYSQLDEDYTRLLQEYADLNSSYVLERETLVNRTRVGDEKFKIFFNDLSLEYHQDVIVSINTVIDTDMAGILTGHPFSEKTVISIGWNYTEEPDLNATLKEAYASIEQYVNATSLNNTMMKDDYEILYVNFTSIVDGKLWYALVSTWYDAGTSRQYLCVVRQEEANVVATFSELMASLRKY